jgi:UDP-N-acetylmuramyl tripeptide synthase
LGRRANLAAATVRGVNRASRALGRGSGTVIGGRAGLWLDPDLLRRLAADRRVALVSGTNGKTTTTRMVAVAVGERLGPVATNETGANMPAGHVAAMAAAPESEVAVLEVDEGYLGQLLEAAPVSVVVLLNLSRDQLDRVAEVRLVAARWRSAFEALDHARPERPPPVVVANADDPLVVWAASAAPDVRWVGAGLVWQADAVGCPACGGRISFEASGSWRCDRCALARPHLDLWLDGDDLVASDGTRRPLRLRVPGRFNRANAALAVAAGSLLLGGDGRSVDGDVVAGVLGRIGAVDSVEGRFATVARRGRDVRLVLAKNPAGWMAVLDLLDGPAAADGPVVLSINARTADGHDPSWLWDVPFERLTGRRAVATGDRRRDLAVRLRYAEVDHEVVEDPLDAVDRALELAPVPPGAAPPPELVFVGNYTAFADVRRRLR